MAGKIEFQLLVAISNAVLNHKFVRQAETWKIKISLRVFNLLCARKIS